jgi:hypothetical protein
LIEHWDGTSWTIVASPNTSSTQFNFLFGAANQWSPEPLSRSLKKKNEPVVGLGVRNILSLG